VLAVLLLFGYLGALPLLHVVLLRRFRPRILAAKLDPYVGLSLHVLALALMIIGASIPATSYQSHLAGGMDVGSAYTLGFSMLANTASAAACMLHAGWQYHAASKALPDNSLERSRAR
jgi:hypothetical protein